MYQHYNSSGMVEKENKTSHFLWRKMRREMIDSRGGDRDFGKKEENEETKRMGTRDEN
jgi:hypothetical protein